MARVSVGVPTYNGAEFLHDCLECLRTQTFEDFEVIIVDNASTDATAEIAAKFTKTDQRFRYHRNPQTIPAVDNFRTTFDLSHADYFMWRADDDLCSSNYVQALADALDATPHAGLAAPTISVTNNLDKTTSQFPPPQKADPVSLLDNGHPAWIYGLWRKGRATDDLFRMQNAYPYLWASDHLGMLPVIVRGEVVLCPQATFNQRIYRKPSYVLAPSDLVKARRAYSKLAMPFVNEVVTKEIMERHIENRVAPFIKAYRRLAESSIRQFLRLQQRR